MPNIKTINNAPSVMVFNKQINDIKLTIHGREYFYLIQIQMEARIFISRFVQKIKPTVLWCL